MRRQDTMWSLRPTRSMEDDYSGQPEGSPLGDWLRSREALVPSHPHWASYALPRGLQVRLGQYTDCNHQQMLLEVQKTAQPSMIVVSPMDIFPALSSNATAEERELLQERENVTMNFVKTLAANQANSGKGFIVEGPWNSQRWKKTCLSTLGQDIQECRPRQRSDVCAYMV